MNPERLLAHFDRIADAPDAIPRLRRFILDLAVRGNLVTQDSSDEPASGLLAQMQTERARLAKAGELRRSDSLPPITREEVPFALPESWVWIRVAEGFLYDAGGKREPRELLPDRWLLELEDIEKDTGIVLARHKVLDRESRSTKSEFQMGDILYGKLRPYLNKVVVATEPGYSTTEIVAIRPLIPLCPDYCSLGMRRPDFVAYVNRAGQGTKMPRLRTPDALRALFPLPPLAEQHRIVAKVDELMALCDRLEAAQAEREARRDRLAAASLHRLNQPADGPGSDAFRNHARFYLNLLPRLTVRPDQIPALRQTILNLAVRGQLVPQNPNDEHASLLFNRIQAEKNRLATERDLAPVSQPPSLGAGNGPFQLPKGWVWVRWNQIALKIGDVDHKMPDTATEGFPYISPRDFRPGNRIDFESAKRISSDDFTRLSKKIKPDIGDLIYPRYGTIGENRLVEVQRDFLVSYSCAIVKVLQGFVDPKFQYLFSISFYCKRQAKEAENKATQPNVGVKSIQDFLVPLPPLAEQRRIVAKVDNLMTVCDSLESRITAGREVRRQLLEAIVHNALEPVPLTPPPAAEYPNAVALRRQRRNAEAAALLASRT